MCRSINKVKVTFFGEPEFYVNNEKKAVACRLQGMVDGLADEYGCYDYYFDKTAVAKCHPEDEFDIALGMRIAHAKAENMAYKYAANKCAAFMDKLSAQMNAIDDFIEKASNCRTHNVDYIKRISSENE